jgi:hypothetical protein
MALSEFVARAQQILDAGHMPSGLDNDYELAAIEQREFGAFLRIWAQDCFDL